MAFNLESILFAFVAVCAISTAVATPVLWDGRLPLNFTANDLDASADPYLSVVKGSEKASQYTQLLGNTSTPTALWSSTPSMQVISISVTNTSIFVPGNNPSNAQNGFRRTELLAQKNKDWHNLLPDTQTGTTVFHWSFKKDLEKPLDFLHEYQVVFIEPSDGSHIFGVQLGSPFTNPTSSLPSNNAYDIKLLDHAKNIIYSTPFSDDVWHNFAVQVDWSKRTLAVLYSKDGEDLKPVTRVVQNSSAQSGSSGQGEFHIGVLKLPLANPSDTPEHRNDVVHYGIQPGSTDGLYYSGVFIESTRDGISVGNGKTISVIT